MHVALVERLAPQPGERWLDLGCGTGDVAFHAAQAAPIVTGSDLSPTLIETAQQRAGELGLDRHPRSGRLPGPPARRTRSFDVVSSSVGVIFAPDHARVASELARVCRPGGRLGSPRGGATAASATSSRACPASCRLRRKARARRSSGARRTTSSSCSGTRTSCRSRSSTRGTTTTTPRRCGSSSGRATGRRTCSGAPSTTTGEKRSTRR